MAAQRFRPDHVADRMRTDVSRYAEAFLEYPFQLSELLDEFKDGELEITSRPGSGTTVRGRLPIDTDARVEEGTTR